MAQLIIEEGGGRREYTLDEASVVIGRDVNCEIPIRDSMSSRRHCEVRREGGGWVLEDLQSSNGTNLNGQAARQAPLRHGDVIRIGEVRIRFLDEAVASEETPVPAVRPAASEPPPKASPVRPVRPVQAAAAPKAASTDASGVTLVVVSGPQEGTEVEVDAVPFTLGRKPQNSFPIADRRVSGEHARIVREDGVWIIEDLDSGNGLVVGGRRAKRLRLVNDQEITIGDTVISFRGLPAVSKAERASAKGARAASAPLADEFADASQRISIEVDPPGRFHAVASLGFLVSLLAIFYFGFEFVSDYVKSRLPSIEANNRLGEYSSFESVDDGGKPIGWSVDPSGDPAELRSIEEGAPHGQRALSVSSAGGNDRGFVRVMSEPVPVSADREFELSAAMRNQGFIGVGVGVQWIGQTGGTVGESYTRLLGDRREYSTVDARVRPPEAQGVSQCRVVLFGWGSGDFDVDHVKLLELEDRTDPAPTLTYRPSEDGQNLEFSFTDRATFSVRGERDLLVREARLAGPSDGERRFPFGQLIATSKKPVFDEATSTVRSSFALPSTGRERLAYQLLARSSADGLNLSYQKLSGPEGRPRLLVEITDSVASLPLHVYQDGVLQGSSDRLDETPPATGNEWVVGSRQRQLNVTFSVPTRGALLPAELTRGVETLVFEPAIDLPNGIWDLAFSSVSQREAERIRTAFAEATGARDAREYGRAIEILAQLRRDFSWKPELGQRIATEIARIEEEGERRLAELDAIRIDFERHQADPIFRNYLARCEEIAAQYEGTDIGERANEMLERISADRSAAVRMVEAKDAKDVLKQAQSFFDGQHNNLARLYAERVLALAPDAEVERQAQQLIRLVEARNLER